MNLLVGNSFESLILLLKTQRMQKETRLQAGTLEPLNQQTMEKNPDQFLHAEVLSLFTSKCVSISPEKYLQTQTMTFAFANLDLPR